MRVSTGAYAVVISNTKALHPRPKNPLLANGCESGSWVVTVPNLNRSLYGLVKRAAESAERSERSRDNLSVATGELRMRSSSRRQH